MQVGKQGRNSRVSRRKLLSGSGSGTLMMLLAGCEGQVPSGENVSTLSRPVAKVRETKAATSANDLATKRPTAADAASSAVPSKEPTDKELANEAEEESSKEPAGETPDVAESIAEEPVSEEQSSPVQTDGSSDEKLDVADNTPTPGLLAGLRSLEGYGFQAHLYNQNRSLITGLTREAGFNWLKQQIWWKYTEPIEKGGYDWAELDKVVGDVSAANLQLLLSVVQAPGWALGGREHGPPANSIDFKDFMAALANRYYGRIQAYEIWNETNFAREWGVLDGNSYRAYGELLKAGYEGVKGIDPDAIVVFGAPTPTGVVDPNIAMDDAVYLQRVYEAMPEISQYYDAMGAHPPGYNNAPDQSFGTERGQGWNGHNSFYFLRFTDYRSIMEQHGDGDKPIWFTEFGWSTANQAEGYGYGSDNTEEDQARFLLEAFELVRRDYSYVTHMFVWNLNFQMVVGPDDEKYPFGLIRSDGSPRPGYLALKAMAKGL